ncbi:MAG: response regulator transcription factor [Verrucomicrobia bacterium]|nr:response regulator transcription factor [Verrucomicrobiota bacterium]
MSTRTRFRNGAHKRKLLLVDDQEINLAALRLYFASRTSFQVRTLWLDRMESIRKPKALKSDVTLVNLSMRTCDAANVTKALLEVAPASKVIGFNGADDRGMILAMLRAGARGYLNKACTSAEIGRALATVQRGELFFSPSVLKMVAVDYASGESQPGRPASGALPDRDRKIIAFIADGLCNKEIAGALGLSVRTIEKYRETLMAKLRIRTVSGLTKYAIRHAITRLDSP